MNLVMAMPRLASNAATIALVPPEVLMGELSPCRRRPARPPTVGRVSIVPSQIVTDRGLPHPPQATAGCVGHNRVHAPATSRSYGRTYGRLVRGLPLRSSVGRNVLGAWPDQACLRVGLRRAADVGRRGPQGALGHHGTDVSGSGDHVRTGRRGASVPP